MWVPMNVIRMSILRMTHSSRGNFQRQSHPRGCIRLSTARQAPTSPAVRASRSPPSPSSSRERAAGACPRPRGARAPLCPRAGLPAERGCPGAAARCVARRRTAGAGHDESVLQPRAARRAARRRGRGLHRDPGGHPERQALGVAVIRGAPRGPGRWVPPVRGHGAGGARPGRERGDDGDRGAAATVRALRRRRRLGSRVRAPRGARPPPHRPSRRRVPGAHLPAPRGEPRARAQRGRPRPGHPAAGAHADLDRRRPRERAAPARAKSPPRSSATTT